MAKKLFHVCAGMFLLVASYHFGATSAEGGRGSLDAAEMTYFNGTKLAVAVDRVVYRADYGGGNLVVSPVSLNPVPGTSPIVTVDGVDNVAVLANGDVYRFESDWVLKGNVLTQATPAIRESWGAVKQRYR